MLDLIGEYEVKLDTKGRVRIPTDLLNQLGDESRRPFVITRGMGQCLSVHVDSEWKRTMSELRQLNKYNAEDLRYMRSVYFGGRKVQLDSADRILIPKNLVEFAEIDKEAIIFTFQDQIEIWSKDKFFEYHAGLNGTLDVMANKVLGTKDKEEEQ